MSAEKPIILFFINGMFPTEEEKEFIAGAKKEGIQLQVRNARMVQDDHKPEECDGVHALIAKGIKESFIPKIYKDAPPIEVALKAYLTAKEERAKLVGDTPAPPVQTTENKPAGTVKPTARGGWQSNK